MLRASYNQNKNYKSMSTCNIYDSLGPAHKPVPLLSQIHFLFSIFIHVTFYIWMTQFLVIIQHWIQLLMVLWNLPGSEQSVLYHLFIHHLSNTGGQAIALYLQFNIVSASIESWKKCFGNKAEVQLPSSCLSFSILTSDLSYVFH